MYQSMSVMREKNMHKLC